MRVVHVGQRGEIGLEDVLVVPLRKEPQGAMVTVTECLNDLLVVSLLGRGNASRGGKRRGARLRCARLTATPAFGSPSPATACMAGFCSPPFGDPIASARRVSARADRKSTRLNSSHLG